jgi:hypothetical protein
MLRKGLLEELLAEGQFSHTLLSLLAVLGKQRT